MDDIRAARLALKWQLRHEWPGLRCACGEMGATDLGHIAYTRHPDSVDLYDLRNMVMLHNACNCNERLWVNVNACLILLERAGGPKEWEEWARTIPRKGAFWIPEKMHVAMDLWDKGIRPFEIDRIQCELGYSKPPNGR